MNHKHLAQAPHATKPPLSSETIERLLQEGRMLVNDLRPLQESERQAIRSARLEGSRGEFLVWWSNGDVSILGCQLVSALQVDRSYRSGFVAVLAIGIGAST